MALERRWRGRYARRCDWRRLETAGMLVVGWYSRWIREWSKPRWIQKRARLQRRYQSIDIFRQKYFDWCLTLRSCRDLHPYHRRSHRWASRLAKWWLLRLQRWPPSSWGIASTGRHREIDVGGRRCLGSWAKHRSSSQIHQVRQVFFL